MIKSEELKVKNPVLEGDKAFGTSKINEDSNWCPLENLRLSASVYISSKDRDSTCWDLVSTLMHLQPEAKNRPEGFYSTTACQLQFDKLKIKHQKETAARRIKGNESSGEALSRVLAIEAFDLKTKQLFSDKNRFGSLQSKIESNLAFKNHSRPFPQTFNPATVIEVRQDAVQFKSPYESAEHSTLTMAEPLDLELETGLNEIKIHNVMSLPQTGSSHQMNLNTNFLNENVGKVVNEKRHFDFETLQKPKTAKPSTSKLSKQSPRFNLPKQAETAKVVRGVKSLPTSAISKHQLQGNDAHKAKGDKLKGPPKEFVWDDIPYSVRLTSIARKSVSTSTVSFLENGAGIDRLEIASSGIGTDENIKQNSENLFEFHDEPLLNPVSSNEDKRLSQIVTEEEGLCNLPESSVNKDERVETDSTQIEEINCSSPIPSSAINSPGTSHVFDAPGSEDPVFPEILNSYSLSPQSDQEEYQSRGTHDTINESSCQNGSHTSLEDSDSSEVSESLEEYDDLMNGRRTLEDRKNVPKESLEHILGLVISHPSSSIFFSQHVIHLQAICRPRRPMDLMEVKNRIDSGEITTVMQLERDLLLTFFNAFMIHPLDHPIAKKGFAVFHHVQNVMKKFRENRDLEKNMKEESQSSLKAVGDGEGAQTELASVFSDRSFSPDIVNLTIPNRNKSAGLAKNRQPPS